MANQYDYDDQDRDPDWNDRSDWERTRQWRRNSSQYRGKYQNRPENRDRDVFGDRYGQNYRDDWDRRIADEYDEGQNDRSDYNRDVDRDYQHRQSYANYNRNRSNRMPYPGARPYPTAGMLSDYGGDYDYEDDPRSRENLNYSQGDIGYDDEGAFYQDMDEPRNYESWNNPLPNRFTGMGPQNYRRSDQRIQEDVCEILTAHGYIDASDIEINVQGGEVTLKGTVPDRQMKRLAEDVVEDIGGVTDINNQIKVQKQNRDTRSWESRWPEEVERSRAGQSNAGAGLTDVGATSFSGMEAAGATEGKRSSLREGMEVIGTDGKVVGRVKEIRMDDFLVDRDMSRDVYVPDAAIQTVGAQVMLKVKADEVDNQDWQKPNLI